MHRVGIGLVFVGAGIWIVSGIAVFSSDFARGYAGATRGAQVASAALATGADTDVSAVSGNQGVVVTPTFAPVQVSVPWYERFFGNFSAFFLQIVPGLGAPVHKGPIIDVTPPPPASAPQPACAISINPNSVPYDGSATVMWSARNADHVLFQGVGEVAPSGSMAVSHLTSARAFALAVKGAGGTSSCYTVVDVGAVSIDPPNCIISAHPSTISAGDTANLAWGAKNVSAVTLVGFGSVAAVGGTAVSPKTTTTYTLTARSQVGKQTSCETTVHVQ